MIKRIYIEITNVCNLSCAFCKKNHRNAHFLTLKEFKHILNQIKPYTSYIYLHVQGEPLMHPQLKEFLDLAYNMKFYVHLTTNGTLLHKHLMLMQHPSIRKLAISLQAIDYSSIGLEDYFKTLSSLIEQKPSNQYLELRFWNYNQLQKQSSYLYQKLQHHFFFQPTKKPNSFQIQDKVYVHLDSIWQWPSMLDEDQSHIGYCLGAKEMLAILSNGQVTACCMDESGQINFGNIFQQSIKDILASKRYLDMVNGFNKHQVVESLCQKCTYRLRFNTKKAMKS